MLLYYVNDETNLISSSSLQPHFFADSPSPPPPIVVFVPPSSTAPPPSEDAGERAWEGAPAAVVVGHAPPPKNVERDIYEYVDRKNKDTIFTTNLI